MDIKIIGRNRFQSFMHGYGLLGFSLFLIVGLLGSFVGGSIFTLIYIIGFSIVIFLLGILFSDPILYIKISDQKLLLKRKWSSELTFKNPIIRPVLRRSFYKGYLIKNASFEMIIWNMNSMKMIGKNYAKTSKITNS